MKFCPFCRRSLELEQFPADDRYVDGHGPRCLSCLDPERRSSAPELAVLPAEEPPKNPWIEAKRRLSVHRNARKAVERAIKSGALKPLPCEYRFEGCVGKPVQAHHHRGYREEHWLSVRWACRPCHDRLTAGRERDHERVR